MLGKLFVSEIKQTYKPMATTAAILVLSTLLANLETNVMRWLNVTSDNVVGIIISALMGMIFVGSVFAVVIVGFVFLIGGFYKSMYSERGYLTHTLPVSSNMTFSVKFIVATLWMVVAAVVIIACCVFRGVSSTGESVGEFFSRLEVYFRIEGLSDLVFFGKTVGGTIAKFAGLALLGILSSFLFFFTAITLGQLSNEHKVGCAIGAGVGLYMIQQLIGFIFTILLIVGQVSKAADLSGSIKVLNGAVVTGLILYIVFMVAEYAVDMYIVKKHLNLQ